MAAIKKFHLIRRRDLTDFRPLRLQSCVRQQYGPQQNDSKHCMHANPRVSPYRAKWTATKVKAAPRHVRPIRPRTVAGRAFECASGRMSEAPMYSKNPAKNPMKNVRKPGRALKINVEAAPRIGAIASNTSIANERRVVLR